MAGTPKTSNNQILKPFCLDKGMTDDAVIFFVVVVRNNLFNIYGRSLKCQIIEMLILLCKVAQYRSVRRGGQKRLDCK